MIIFSGIEWDYNNLEGIGYDSETLSKPYTTWFFQITDALNYEQESINLGLSDEDAYSSLYKSKDNVIKLKDYSTRIVTKIIGDQFAISDGYARKVGHHNLENITLSDKRISELHGFVSEPTMYFLDEARCIYQKTGETPVTIDQVELSGSACLFDFEAKDGVWSKKDFDGWCDDSCPVNYNQLRPFIPGEYEYTDAYVGFRLTIPPTSGRFGVAHSTVYVDVEDTVGKGTVEHSYNSQTSQWEIKGGTIANGVATVELSKRFYTYPHIMTSLNFAQENCFIEVIEISREYFKFKIKSIASGSYVTDTVAWSINWLADGY